MKTVSGEVVSSKPVSLSKAAKILSKFALADNGASSAYVAYLKRASDSFAELVQFHKELRGSASERKSKKHRSGNHIVGNPVDSVANHSEDWCKEDSIGTRKKDSKEKKDQAALVNGHDSKKKKNTKEIQGNSDDDSRESRKRKKGLKKNRKEDQGNVDEMKVEDQNWGKRSKKRKSEEIVDEEAIGSAEEQVHKKKKKKKKGKNESDTRLD